MARPNSAARVTKRGAVASPLTRSYATGESIAPGLMKRSAVEKKKKVKKKKKPSAFEVLCDLEWAMLAVSNNGQACSVRRGSPRQQTISKNGATIQNVQKTGV